MRQQWRKITLQRDFAAITVNETCTPLLPVMLYRKVDTFQVLDWKLKSSITIQHCRAGVVLASSMSHEKMSFPLTCDAWYWMKPHSVSNSVHYQSTSWKNGSARWQLTGHKSLNAPCIYEKHSKWLWSYCDYSKHFWDRTTTQYVKLQVILKLLNQAQFDPLDLQGDWNQPLAPLHFLASKLPLFSSLLFSSPPQNQPINNATSRQGDEHADVVDPPVKTSAGGLQKKGINKTSFDIFVRFRSRCFDSWSRGTSLIGWLVG